MHILSEKQVSTGKRREAANGERMEGGVRESREMECPMRSVYVFNRLILSCFFLFIAVSSTYIAPTKRKPIGFYDSHNHVSEERGRKRRQRPCQAQRANREEK